MNRKRKVLLLNASKHVHRRRRRGDTEEMNEEKRVRIRTRRLWKIKPFERVKKSGKIYSRRSEPESTGDELDERDSRIIGLDFGERRIGISISDPLGLTAQPGGVVDSQEAISSLVKMTTRYDVSLFVIGHPLDASGEQGESAKRVEEFAGELKEATSIPYALVDERFSSRAAERALRDMGKQPSREKAAVDQIAAVMILQSYLDRINSMKHEDDDENI
jgi:putative Holliday junction resolvase